MPTRPVPVILGVLAGVALGATIGVSVVSPGLRAALQPEPAEVYPDAAGPTPTELTSALDVPWGMTFLPSGDALVAERDTGQILQVPAAGGAAVPVVVVPDVLAQGEGGLLGLAVSPDYASDGWVYAYLTTADDNRIVRLRMADDGTAPQAIEVVLAGITKASNHNGGRIGFGPDGMLYAGTGDAAEPDVSQDASDLNGKILRMTPQGAPAPGNPDPQSVVFSVGHRNVQGLAWDSAGRLYATEFGQNTFDEVNLIEAGGNYGWPEVEGPGDTEGGRFVAPLVTWATSQASPSGAAVITGESGEDTLYVAALRGQRLWRIDLDGDGGVVGDPQALYRTQFGRIRTVTAAPDGSLWISTSNSDGNGDGSPDRVLRVATASSEVGGTQEP